MERVQIAVNVGEDKQFHGAATVFIGYASSARALKLATFLIGQCDNNAITNATNEFKRVLVLASDFVT